MLDFRMRTFLQLCETMNYRQTAKQLNMTQPSVTQHIQYLEKEYGCRLFSYDGRRLVKTSQCVQLEQKTRAMFYLEKEIRTALCSEEEPPLNIGATKTIAEFILPAALQKYLPESRGDFSLIVENTEILLGLLDQIAIDFALIEGSFDKAKYESRLFRCESFLGVCSANHRFAKKEVDMEELMAETIIVREEGSGTRSILEDVLKSKNYSLSQFQRLICISQFSVIKQLVAAKLGVTFGFEAIVDKPEGRLSTFKIKGMEVLRELNFVYLKGTKREHTLGRLETFLMEENKLC